MTENEVVDEVKAEEELTTRDIVGMITRNQVTQNDTLKSIRNSLAFLVLLTILGLILGFCSPVL